MFVYGSLKRGGWSHNLISSMMVTYLGEAKTTRDYSLYKTQGPYPAMIKEDSISGVSGELYEIYSVGLNYLDQFECVSTGLYSRELIELDSGEKVYSYIFQHPVFDKIEGGVW